MGCVCSLVPSQPPVELKPVNRISPTKLNVTWKPVPEQFRHGSLTKYIVTYQRVKVGDVKTEEEEEEVKYIEVYANQTHVSLTNLEPYVEYKVSVAAATSKGKGPFAFTAGGKKFYGNPFVHNFCHSDIRALCYASSSNDEYHPTSGLMQILHFDWLRY